MSNDSITLYCPYYGNGTTTSSNANGLSSEFYAMLGLVITTVITSVVSLVVALCTKQKTSEDKAIFTIREIKRPDGTTLNDVSITFIDNDAKNGPAMTNASEPVAGITRQPSSVIGADATNLAQTGGIKVIEFLDRFCGNSEWQKYAVSGDGRTLDTARVAGEATVHVDE